MGYRVKIKKKKTNFISLFSFRKAYHIVTYFFFIYTIFFGFVSALSRSLRALIIGCIFFENVQSSVLPRSFETFDPGMKRLSINFFFFAVPKKLYLAPSLVSPLSVKPPAVTWKFESNLPLLLLPPLFWPLNSLLVRVRSSMQIFLIMCSISLTFVGYY